jgi:CO/xanthine dehydrogenase Mo-binding subunit
MATKRKTVECFWRHADAPRVRQSGRRSVCRLRHYGRRSGRNPAPRPPPKNTLDATLPGSWIEIHPDNTILIRTGKSDFGQSTTFTAYRQIVAEELNAPFEAITTV